MNNDKIYWMNYSISIAEKNNKNSLNVGAVLVGENNKLVCSAYTGEIKEFSWSRVLLKKIKKLHIKEASYLFLTINTLSSKEEFDLNTILYKIAIKKIYIGLPDPSYSKYLLNDPIIRNKNILRYPDNLQRIILLQNAKYYKKSKQNIKFSPYYSINRISNIIIKKLEEKGISISKDELQKNKNINNIIKLIVQKYKFDIDSTNKIVNTVISESFDEKYSNYSYLNDVRSINLDWVSNFYQIYNTYASSPLIDKKVLNVGVGSGNEALILFKKCTNITFVDIAPKGLSIIKEKMPKASIVVAKAENLKMLISNKYDIYISLRTYNSSFFDIKKAISEAHRILKRKGIIIISIANGFLSLDDNNIIPGLLIPGTEFIDIYRGVDIIKEVSTELSNQEFSDISFFPTNIEFLY